MVLSFIKKQFIDVIEWVEDSNYPLLSYRFPMQDMEIQNGAALIVRPSQIAIFINEGKIADIFTQGTYKLNTSNLPLLTNLKNWDKLFISPFKSDVYFFSTRQQTGQNWGTLQPITIRDNEFGQIRIRAFGNMAWRIDNAEKFHLEISGTKNECTLNDISDQLKGMVLEELTNIISQSKINFLDLAINQVALANDVKNNLQTKWLNYGLKIESFTIQNINLPPELQKTLDQKTSMKMVAPSGDMSQYIAFQTAQSLTSENQSGASSIAEMGAAAAIAANIGNAINKNSSLNNESQINNNINDPFILLEKLAKLEKKGILTREEFQAKKSEILNKISNI